MAGSSSSWATAPSWSSAAWWMRSNARSRGSSRCPARPRTCPRTGRSDCASAVNLGDVIIDAHLYYVPSTSAPLLLMQSRRTRRSQSRTRRTKHAAGSRWSRLRQSFKNIARPIRVYGWRTDATEEAAPLGRRDEGCRFPTGPRSPSCHSTTRPAIPNRILRRRHRRIDHRSAVAIRSFFVIARNSPSPTRGATSTSGTWGGNWASPTYWRARFHARRRSRAHHGPASSRPPAAPISGRRNAEGRSTTSSSSRTASPNRSTGALQPVDPVRRDRAGPPQAPAGIGAYDSPWGRCGCLDAGEGRGRTAPGPARGGAGH